jgi:hypothetical protein
MTDPADADPHAWTPAPTARTAAGPWPEDRDLWAEANALLLEALEGGASEALPDLARP